MIDMTLIIGFATVVITVISVGAYIVIEYRKVKKEDIQEAIKHEARHLMVERDIKEIKDGQASQGETLREVVASNAVILAKLNSGSK